MANAPITKFGWYYMQELSEIWIIFFIIFDSLWAGFVSFYFWSLSQNQCGWCK